MRSQWLARAFLGGALALLIGASTVSADAYVPNVSIVVSTADDLVNGDVSSPAALTADPGPDGISLREAISAADDAPAGSHVYVTFAGALSGATIQLAQTAPLRLTHDGLTVAGLDSGGPPSVTITASPTSPACATFLVEASDVVIRNLAFLGGGPSGVISVLIRGGTGWGGSGADSPCLATPGPSAIDGVEIDENTFANLGGSFAHRIDVTNGGASIENVRVSGNTFTDTNGGDDGDGLLAQNWSTGSTIDGLTIERNTFDSLGFGVELQPATSGDQENPAGTGDGISGVRISHNVFDQVGNPVWIGTLALGAADTGNVMTGTVIDANVFDMGSAPASGITLVGGSGNASSNTIENTQIVNNLLFGVNPGISLYGGGSGDASDNTVDGVEIANDTLANSSLTPELWVSPTFGSGTGDTVTGLDVRNTVFSANGWPFTDGISTGQVSFSLLGQPGFPGINGNISADPAFVDPTSGDYHLSSSSPAIDAGTATSAPATDLEDRARAGTPDMGAYEFGAPSRPLLTVDVGNDGGGGVVTSAPSGISCTTVCRAAFDGNGTVTLSAAADSASRFAGWSGACSGSAADCTVTMSAAETVTATFAARTPPGISSFRPVNVGAGTTVTIDGSSFTGATAVTFNGTPAASFTVVNDGEITAQVAGGTTSGKIAVTTPTGTSTSGNPYTFFAQPTITSLSTTGVGTGSTVTVNGTSLNGATSVTLHGTRVPFTVVSSAQITFTVPAGATNGTVTVVTPGGSATSSDSITVMPPPTITSFTPENGSVGTTITVTGTNLDHVVAVEIGHILTVPTSASATQVVFTIPPGATTGTITVLGSTGSATSAGTLTVTP